VKKQRAMATKECHACTRAEIHTVTSASSRYLVGGAVSGRDGCARLLCREARPGLTWIVES
jgi:hypothetical protein